MGGRRQEQKVWKPGGSDLAVPLHALGKDLSVPLMHHDPCNRGLLILCWIIPKEHTQSFCILRLVILPVSSMLSVEDQFSFAILSRKRDCVCNLINIVLRLARWFCITMIKQDQFTKSWIISLNMLLRSYYFKLLITHHLYSRNEHSSLVNMKQLITGWGTA